MKTKSKHQNSCTLPFLKHQIFSLVIFLSILSPCSTFLSSPPLLFLSFWVVSIASVFIYPTKRQAAKFHATSDNECLVTSKAKGQAQEHEEDQSPFKTESFDDSSKREWPQQENVEDGDASIDGSISDEENLIEIALADVNFMNNTGKSYKPVLGMNLLDYLPESVLKQHGLIELFSEMNEDDSLIEIDISLGSIKCSTLEIEAFLYYENATSLLSMCKDSSQKREDLSQLSLHPFAPISCKRKRV